MQAAMDYYEELGVRRGAPVEEIRRAWRNLARLLHPDQQQDESLRLLAERQMKRLNEVCAVLTDPLGRLRYDQSLFAAPPLPPPARRWAVARQHWPLVVVFAVSAITTAVLYPRRAAPRAPSREPAVAAAPAVPTPRPTRRRSTHRDAPALPRHRQEPSPADVLPAPIVPAPEIAAASPDPPPPDLPSAAALPQSAQESENGVAGAWFFAPQKTPGSALLYPPEFIEVFITETSGVLHGRYRARYKVGDQPISGDVQFSFEGQHRGHPVVLPWTGSEGSCGEIRLRLLDDDSLQVTWQATRLGYSMGLASGTAILARRREI
jgi:hypothetical protein